MGVFGAGKPQAVVDGELRLVDGAVGVQGGVIAVGVLGMRAGRGLGREDAVHVGDRDMGLARGLGRDLERDVRESGHILAVNLVEGDVPALHLLVHGRGVLAGLNECRYEFGRGVRGDLLKVDGAVAQQVTGWGLRLLDRHSTKRKCIYFPISGFVKAIARYYIFFRLCTCAQKTCVAVFVRFQNPGSRGLLGQVVLGVEAVIVLDGELSARERAGTERGGLARLGIDLGDQHVSRVVLGGVGDVHGRRLATRHAYLVDPLIERIGLSRFGLLDVVGARGDIDHVGVAEGVAGERSHLLGATGVGVDAVGRAVERVARVVVGDAGVGARLLELQLALVVEGDEALGSGAVVDEVDRILE